MCYDRYIDLTKASNRPMNKKLFGTMPDGTPIMEYTLENENFSVSIINYGGILRRYVAYGTDIVCGFDCLEHYLADTSQQGALIGRYANRIDGGCFTLNGKKYSLNCNDRNGTVHLHGGPTGFSRRVWTVTEASRSFVTLHLVSPDGDEGYPGNLTVDVTYALTRTGLAIDYIATTDADTPLSLTNHSYFNLDGCGNGDILDTVVTIYADEYSTLNERMIPNGHAPVAGTVFDFTAPTAIGARGMDFGGYDHNYILRDTDDMKANGHALTHACDADNGKLTLSVYTTTPCIQFYIANALQGEHPFKGGSMPTPRTAFCFEAQTEPNGPNRGEGILRAGDIYRQYTFYGVKRH